MKNEPSQSVLSSSRNQQQSGQKAGLNLDDLKPVNNIEGLGDGGDLYDFIQKNPNGVDENQARSIFRQAVSAIQYCHQLHVVHRDLKPENLVFCKTGGVSVVKLTDFGLSRTFAPGEMIELSCGSLEYSAPEILLGDFYDPPKVGSTSIFWVSQCDI